MADIPYYHGGVPGLFPGRMLLPPSMTSFCAEHAARARSGSVGRADRVYVTTSIEAAAMYAALYPRPSGGAVYRVDPIGALEHDPDCDEPGLSFACERAKVIERVRIPRETLREIREELARG